MFRFIKEKMKGIATNIFNYHTFGDKKDIVILSSPRSGSTWLMEILYSQPGFKYIYEPLGKNILDYNRLIPIETRWNYITLNDKEKKILKEYFLDDREIKHFGPRNIFHKDYNFFTNRRVIKIIRGNGLITWFSEELNFKVIYLIRHPIAQSLSCIKRHHRYEIMEYLDNEYFVRQFLNAELKEFCLDVVEKGTELEKFVTEWCLDNLISLDKSKNKHDWIFLTYEELVKSTKKVLEFLYKRLNLEDKQRLLSNINTPSKTTDSSSRETRKNIKEEEKGFLISKWKKEISDEVENKLFEIVRKFNVDVYQEGKFLPRNEYLIFSGDFEKDNS